MHLLRADILSEVLHLTVTLSIFIGEFHIGHK